MKRNARNPRSPAARRAVRLEHGLRQGAVPHRAPVHEQAQVGRAGRGRSGRDTKPRTTAQSVPPSTGRRSASELAAEELVEARGQGVHRRGLDDRPSAGAQREAGARPRQRQQRHRLGDVRGLGRGRAQELAARRHRAEQVANLDRRSPRVPGVPHVQRAGRC